MVFVVYDGSGDVFRITQNWPMARAALDYLVSCEEEKPPALEIHKDVGFIL